MPITPTRNQQFFINVGTSILESAADALQCYGLDIPDRLFVGFDRPPQDCCPELVAWIDNIRLWDGEFPDTSRGGGLLQVFGYAFDVTIRIGRCYVDYDDDGPLDTGTLTDFSGHLYADATALYMGWLHQWRAGNVTELTKCDLGEIGPMTSYHEGGCAGWEFRITVGVF